VRCVDFGRVPSLASWTLGGESSGPEAARMDDGSATGVSALIQRAMGGDRAAEDALFRLLYPELRRRAGAMMRRQPVWHTLQATALVHEAWLRLGLGGGQGGDQGGDGSTGGPGGPEWAGRNHFVGAAASAMRQVLVDHARTRDAQKRGGGLRREPLDELLVAYEERSVAMLDLDAALERLAAKDPRAARVVELRFFGGMTMADVAATLGVPLRTVERDWRAARARLLAELG
jgi:RNA polymerase sigma-70 factor, ECF subfamily